MAISWTVPTLSDSATTLVSLDVGPSPKENQLFYFRSGNKDAYQVALEPENDPKNMSYARKWLAVFAICSASTCVTCASAISAFTESGETASFHVSSEVTTLGVSVYVLGLAAGGLIFGPLSGFYGRQAVYRVSYFLSFACSWPVAFAPNIAVFLIFRVLVGFFGAAYTSVGGGSISDLFTNKDVSWHMATYTLSTFVGLVVGPLVSGFIAQHMEWRWTYRVQIIWTFAELVLLTLFVPETYEPILLRRKARRLRNVTGDSRYYAPVSEKRTGIMNACSKSCQKPFQILIQEPMALFISLWNALVLGILYLTFQAFPFIFQNDHGFNLQMTGMSFLGIGFGMILAWASQWVWNRFYNGQAEKHGGDPPPETRLVMGMIGGVLVPFSLLLVSLTSTPTIPPIVPIILSFPFGTGLLYVFISSFTYLVTVYRPHAASVLAANTTLRCVFSAAFPLFAVPMYSAMGSRGATGVLAGATGAMAVLPFILFKYGSRVRSISKFASSLETS